jgi:hypothetical protein
MILLSMVAVATIFASPTTAQAHVDVDIGIGAPAPIYYGPPEGGSYYVRHGYAHTHHHHWGHHH